VAVDSAGCVGGFASTIESGDVPVLVELYVAREYRRQYWLGVIGGVHPNNTKARRLCRRHGFVAEGGALMALRFG
jgi:hypothetical protein